MGGIGELIRYMADNLVLPYHSPDSGIALPENNWELCTHSDKKALPDSSWLEATFRVVYWYARNPDWDLHPEYLPKKNLKVLV